jgi:NADPH-dependent curcumin reductase CurA
MTTVQVVDSMSSVVDLQILAIEKTLLSIDRYMQTNMNDDIAKLITSFNIGVRSFISKVLEKVVQIKLLTSLSSKCSFLFELYIL